MTQRQLFLQHLAQTSPFPLMLEIEKAQGIYLYDKNGKAHIDFISGIGVSGLGHCHPAVVKAVKNQAETFMHTMVYGEYVLSPQVNLAKRLAEHLPPNLNSVYFVNSGAEATEGVMKLAKRYTGRKEIISCRYAYHGSTQGAASLMNPSMFTDAFQPLLPEIEHINFNCHFCLSKITNQTAAVIIEPIQAEVGILLPNKEWMLALRQKCTEVGAMLVFDEIQTGMGRTGTLWAFEGLGVIPDALLLAKGLGGGMPIGAFITQKEIMLSLSENPILGHITTFGGHPVSCAAALATLETLLEEKEIIEKVEEKSNFIQQTLENHPLVLEIRKAGLMIAVDLGSFELVQKVIGEAMKNGLIVDWFLFNDRSIRLAPPLIITQEELSKACHILLQALDSQL